MHPCLTHATCALPSYEEAAAALLAPYGTAKHTTVLRIAPHGAPQQQQQGLLVIVRAMMGSTATAAQAIRGINAASAAERTAAAGAVAAGVTAVAYMPKSSARMFQSSCTLKLSISSGVPTHFATAEFVTKAGRDAVMKRLEVMPARHGLASDKSV